MDRKILDDEIREETKPVLLELGIGLKICQSFEYSLCLLLSLLSEEQEPSDGARFQATWDFHSRKVLGYLVTTLTKHLDIPPDYEEYLRQGIEARNEIVHRFMNRPENLKQLFDPAGRLKLIEQLSELKEVVRTRDKSLRPLVDALLEKYGVSVESLIENAEGIWEWNARGPGKDSKH